jgi:hypothetical protein
MAREPPSSHSPVTLMSKTCCLLLLLLTASHVVAQESKDGDKSTKKSKAIQLFNGKDLKGWRLVEKFDFARHGKVEVKDGVITMAAGAPASGIRIDSKVHEMPRTNYEVSLEAKRTSGQDFFCGLTFPVDKQYCTLIMGGWGGGTIGLSNIDNAPADENETTNFVEFKKNQWYQVRVRVTDKQIDVWIDEEHLIELERADHKFSIWWEQEPMRPLGFASWYTGAAYRKIELKRLSDGGKKSR